MPVTLAASGTQTVVIGTEHTIYNPTTNRFFTGYIDLTNMGANDVVEIRVSVIIKTAGTYVLYWMGSYSAIQANPLIYIPTLPSDIGYKVTIKQTVGTVRTYDYRFYEI